MAKYSAEIWIPYVNIRVGVRNKVYIRLAIPQNFYQPMTTFGQYVSPFHYAIIKYFLSSKHVLKSMYVLCFICLKNIHACAFFCNKMSLRA